MKPGIKVFLLIVVIGAISCTTTNGSEVKDTPQSAPSTDKAKQVSVPKNCPRPFVTCIAQYLPTSCLAKGHDGKEFKENDILRSKGSNKCWAMDNLKKLACEKGLDPEKLEHVNCEEISKNSKEEGK